MDQAGLLVDAFDRVRSTVHGVVEGLDPEALARRPAGRGNSIAWLVWHLTRVQDDHLADAEGREQTWTAAGWAERFGLPFVASSTGYGHTSDEVSAVRATGDVLLGYHDAVHAVTVAYVSGLEGTDLDRVVDEDWDPPVTLAVRLVSVINDDLQHAGQAAYARGLL